MKNVVTLHAPTYSQEIFNAVMTIITTIASLCCVTSCIHAYDPRIIPSLHRWRREVATEDNLLTKVKECVILLQLFIMLLAMRALFTDAKVREDVVEHLGGSDYATGNLGKGFETLAEIFAQEVVWD